MSTQGQASQAMVYWPRLAVNPDPDRRSNILLNVEMGRQREKAYNGGAMSAQGWASQAMVYWPRLAVNPDPDPDRRSNILLNVEMGRQQEKG